MADLHAADKLLVRRLLAGDEAAFDRFFDASFAGLFRFALTRLCHDADAAEESRSGSPEQGRPQTGDL